MKKKVLMIAAFFATVVVNAQETETNEVATYSKPNGISQEILPAKGDWALGFDAAALIETAGGLFYNSGSGVSGKFANQITGKYFLSDKNAVRVKFGFNSTYESYEYEVDDAKAVYDASFGTPSDIEAAQLNKVYDNYTRNITRLQLAVGYEWRKGNGRIQGFYGGDVIVNWTNNNQTMVYGNEISDLYTSEFNDRIVSRFNEIGLNTENQRNLTANYNEISAGARGFIGVEWFFAKKMSLGLEYGFGYSFTTTSTESRTWERYSTFSNDGTPTVYQEELVNKKPNNYRNDFVTDNGFGSSLALTLMVHF